MNKLFYTLLLLTPIFSYGQVYHWANTFPSSSGYTVCSALGASNTILGNSSNVTGGCFVSGYSNTINAGATASHVFGEHSVVGGFASSCFGTRSEASANNSHAIGSYVKSTADQSITIGSGYWSSNYSTNLVNNIPNSLMIGFNSQSPTLFVGPANGGNTIGTVMIGTTELPSAAQGQGYLFAVKGAMIAEKIKVATYSNWSDFVFKKDYNLMSLSQVEQYVNKHSHLPDVPSAEEVKENGYDLAEMDAILLRKIEELYLHMISLKKENEIIKKLIEKK